MGSVTLPVALGLEFRKTRRRHLCLIGMSLLAFQLVWLCANMSSYAKKSPDFTAILAMLPALNAIVLPLLCTVVVSTMVDVENRADMWKELLTMQDARSVVVAKWLCAALVIGVLVTVQTVVVVVVGVSFGLTENIPCPALLAQYWVSTFVVCLMLATIIQAICLATANPFVPLVAGVGLCFLGLFVAYLPQVFSWLIPSAYFFVLAVAGLDFDAASQVARFHVLPLNVPGLVVAVLVTVAVGVLSLRAFSRKEL